MRTRSFRYVPGFLAAALCCGCTITIGGGFTPSGDNMSEDNGAAGGGEARRLPDPTVWRVDPPQLTPEQQQRNEEVEQFLAEEYRDYIVVEATQGYSGDIIYRVDSNSIPGAYPTPPPPPWTQEDLTPPPGAELARTELELYPELRGPEGTTPVHRPDFGVYVMGLTSATSLQDYIESYEESGQQAGQSHLYAGLRSDLLNMGASGTINQFQGDVEEGTFSLIEVAVSCQGLNYATTLEMVGAVVSRDRHNFLDANPRMHVEYLTRGPGSTGHRKGGWDNKYAGFIPQPGRPYGPGVVVPASVPGSGLQQENRFDIWQDAIGNWWVAHNGNTLGHYPAELFDMLNLGACTSAWYGEVADPTPTDWTWTDMGSGELASAGYGYASYVRNPKFRDLLFAPWDPIDDLGTLSSSSSFCKTCTSPKDDNCYSRSVMTVGASPWNSFFYLGGPGGDAVGCD